VRARLQGLAGRLASGLRDSVAGQWFATQSPRDQRVLKLLGAFVAVVGIWLLLWVPVRDGLAVARARHADALEDYRWILAHQDEARTAAAARQGAGGRSGQALLSEVASSARSEGLTLNRFQPEGQDALAVSLDDVEFGALVLWLDRLAREQGVTVRQASIDAREQPGRVRARIVLF
jgi:general secretion pathway protein M